MVSIFIQCIIIDQPRFELEYQYSSSSSSSTRRRPASTIV